MDYVEWKGMRLSKLALGAAQFGMAYGIANRTGAPDAAARRRIIETALEVGVNVIDTAARYGQSERFLGETLAEMNARDAFVVCTKPEWPATEGVIDAGRRRWTVRRSVERSLSLLRTDHLPIVLFHRVAQMVAEDGAALDELRRMHDEGHVDHIGASLYACDDAALCLHAGVACVQAPLSALDFHLEACDFWRRARARGILTFARSAYMQGLLLMDDEDVPAHLQETVPALRRLRAIAREAGLAVKELALKFALEYEGVDVVVLGVETADQLREAARIAAMPALPRGLDAKLRAAYELLPTWAVSPVEWEKRARRT